VLSGKERGLGEKRKGKDWGRTASMCEETLWYIQSIWSSCFRGLKGSRAKGWWRAEEGLQGDG